MPLVRIDVPASITPERRRIIGDAVYETLVDVLNVPEHDNFQIITAHDPNGLHIDSEYLGVDRSVDAFVISITLNAGRSVELKKQFYAELVTRLTARGDVRPQDVFISLTEVSKENWSFGNGEAQYA
jgi:4-oxalocrotonate tautomerase